MGIDYEALGKRIAKRRKVLNLTQEDVAEAAGLSNNFISNIENNYSIPSIDSLLRSAKLSIRPLITFCWAAFRIRTRKKICGIRSAKGSGCAARKSSG